VPGVVSLSQLLKVLQALLAEQVPVRDIRSIAEAIANNAAKSQDTAALVAAVRVGVSRAIVQSIVGTESELPVITWSQGWNKYCSIVCRRQDKARKRAFCWSQAWLRSCSAR
jgi:flagellar biosynthesis component FlhA